MSGYGGYSLGGGYGGGTSGGYVPTTSVTPGYGSGSGSSGSGLLGNLSSNSAGLLRAGIAGGTALLGAGIAGAANTSAAGTAADANLEATREVLAAQQQARDEYQKAAQAGIGYIQQGESNYAGTISPLLTPAPITLPTYRDLTPQQQTGEADLLRTGNATLAASGLRGAGRAGVGAVLDQDRRYQEDARASNDASTLQARQAAQSVANNARTGLANIEAQTGGSEANTKLLVGNELGASYQAGGNTTANLTANTGQTNANATTATGNAVGQALGTAAGAFSSPYTLGSGTPNTPGLTTGAVSGQYSDRGV